MPKRAPGKNAPPVAATDGRNGKTATATATPRQTTAPTGGGPGQPRRAERRAELVKSQREQRRKRYDKRKKEWLLTKIGAGVVVLAVLVGVGFAGYNYVQDRNLNRVPDGVQSFNYAGGDHSEDPLTYTESPPVGGLHSGTWQNCGYYPLPIRSEHAVHSLEHGAVWITYQPDLPQDQIDQLRERAEETTYMLVSPFPGLQTPVVASSWNKQLELQSADDERLDQFIRVFRQGPETPEPGASCTGGTSATVG